MTTDEMTEAIRNGINGAVGDIVESFMEVAQDGPDTEELQKVVKALSHFRKNTGT